jgi:hypothetical protein
MFDPGKFLFSARMWKNRKIAETAREKPPFPGGFRGMEIADFSSQL